ncbi:hypothetical protein F2Q69_00033497 [Brassica cretica]|uniref:Uncharacterized protein n=1 Tax=Brassica cretica TaxID=69181 RepID=A0A8S9SGN2_BRACR|nr:hypothetical protein F2Q69_00033497 [Brassica cretica]
MSRSGVINPLQIWSDLVERRHEPARLEDVKMAFRATSRNGVINPLQIWSDVMDPHAI